MCEDLVNYGFEVTWNPAIRALTVFTVSLPEEAPKYGGSGGQPGTIAGTVYSTDIETVVRGLHIPSYNFGVSPYGFSCKWDAEKRTISLFTLRPGSQVTCDLGRCNLGPLLSNGYLGYSLWERPLRLNGMAEAMHVEWS